MNRIWGVALDCNQNGCICNLFLGTCKLNIYLVAHVRVHDHYCFGNTGTTLSAWASPNQILLSVTYSRTGASLHKQQVRLRLAKSLWPTSCHREYSIKKLSYCIRSETTLNKCSPHTKPQEKASKTRWMKLQGQKNKQNKICWVSDVRASVSIQKNSNATVSFLWMASLYCVFV